MKANNPTDVRQPAQSGNNENQMNKLHEEGKKILKWRENAEVIR